jgi:hypothetical protein
MHAVPRNLCPNPSAPVPQQPPVVSVDQPRWDGCRRELWWGGRLVKRFRQPAPNQEALLAAFEELGWPEWMDDPLPREKGIDPQERLHDTVKGLNRHQRQRLLHFCGDGTGQRIGWCLVR